MKVQYLVQHKLMSKFSMTVDLDFTNHVLCYLDITDRDDTKMSQWYFNDISCCTPGYIIPVGCILKHTACNRLQQTGRSSQVTLHKWSSLSLFQHLRSVKCTQRLLKVCFLFCLFCSVTSKQKGCTLSFSLLVSSFAAVPGISERQTNHSSSNHFNAHLMCNLKFGYRLCNNKVQQGATSCNPTKYTAAAFPQHENGFSKKCYVGFSFSWSFSHLLELFGPLSVICVLLLLLLHLFPLFHLFQLAVQSVVRAKRWAFQPGLMPGTHRTNKVSVLCTTCATLLPWFHLPPSPLPFTCIARPISRLLPRKVFSLVHYLSVLCFMSFSTFFLSSDVLSVMVVRSLRVFSSVNKHK